MRRGVKPLDTRVRNRRWAGSSIARNDMVRYASVVREIGSSETPSLLESAVLLRNPLCTSACRVSAQKLRSSFR